MNNQNRGRGEMTVREAGQRGGKKGGETTSSRYGHEFYQDIGQKGGRKVRDLIRKGEENERG